MRQNDADLDHHTAVNLNYRNKLFSLRETVELVRCSNYLPRKQNCTGIEREPCVFFKSFNFERVSEDFTMWFF